MTFAHSTGLSLSYESISGKEHYVDKLERAEVNSNCLRATRVGLDKIEAQLDRADWKVLSRGETLSNERIREIATLANRKIGAVKFALVDFHHKQAFLLTEGRGVDGLPLERN